MTTPQNKIILKSVYGSHLYGLNTPTSDEDFYYIFKATLEEIILKKDKDCFTSDENNIQFKELRHFLKDAMSGQTYAIELLFAPEDKYLYSTSTWSYIRDNRAKLLSKNLRPFLGYAQSQAKKYTGRTVNFQELVKAVEVLSRYGLGQTLGEVEGLTFTDKITTKEITLGNGMQDKYIRFFHKEFPLGAKLSTVIPSIQKYIDEYGDRTRFYSSKQYDCKAFSHALRLCYMLDELMLTGNISFPIKNREFLLGVKLNTIPYDTVQSELDKILAQIDVNINVLPEKPDIEFWEQFVLREYTL